MKTMVFFTFVCCCSLISAVAFSQEIPPDVRTWSLQVDDSRYIFADTAFVRISADTKQAPVDTLFAGDDITVTAITEKMLNLKGLNAPWVEIKYKKNGIDRQGFLWQGLISFAPMRRGDTKFVYAIDRHVDSTFINDGVKTVSKMFLVKLKVVQAGKLIATSSCRVFDGEEANFTESKIMSSLGLSNVQNIITLSFNGAACGVPSYYFYFAWMNGGRLVPLPDRYTVGDAGVFYHDETFTFPAEKNGVPDMIFWNMVEEEETEKVNKKGEPVMLVKKDNAKYSWDGVNGTFQKQGK
jgi:hypothetical protein